MKLSRQRGSLLIITLVFVIVLSGAAISVLELSRNSYRLSMRNQLQAEARAVAESEMEYLFFRFKSEVMAGTAAQGVPAVLSSAGISDLSDTLLPSAAGVSPVFIPTAFTPFQATHRSAGWTIHRALITNRYLQNERFPGTTKEGSFTYLIAQIEVIPPASSPFGTTANVRIGRRFSNSSAPIFQYSIFSQGDLEFNPGGPVGFITTITGDVVANGNIFMGVQSGRSINIVGKVRYLSGGYYNGSTGATYYNPVGPNPGVTFYSPTFMTSQTSQLETIDEPENLLGGIDVTATANGRPDLFGPTGSTDTSAWTTGDFSTAENNVYRSLIVPPPPTAATIGTATSEFPNAITTTPDDSVISVQRAYNKAALRITVDETTGYPTFKQFDLVARTETDITSTFIPCITRWDIFGNASLLGIFYTKNVYDYREGKNITITEIDISKLKAIIDNQRTLPAGDPFNIHLNFNGLLYVNLRRASYSTPAAVRLINASSLPYNPNVAITSGLTGFSIATNGGIYIKADVNNGYNTVAPVVGGVPVYPRPEDGTAGVVPAMIIADAITLLSKNWNDANANLALASRPAYTGAPTYFNAGILTGNIPTTTTASSGGAQNLVRYLENWSSGSAGQGYVNFNGSIGRLFTPTKFVAPYLQSQVGSVYNPPIRSFSFDHNILIYAPPGTPSTTSFSRGDFFTW